MNVFVAMQHPWNGIFLGSFWALSPPNMTQVCWNFDQTYVSYKAKTVPEQTSKIKSLSWNGTYPKLPVLVHFWAQLSARKLEILPKTKIFTETKSYDYQITQASGPDKSHNSYQINKKNIFWAKNRLLQVKNRPANKDQEIRLAPYFWKPLIQS